MSDAADLPLFLQALAFAATSTATSGARTRKRRPTSTTRSRSPRSSPSKAAWTTRWCCAPPCCTTPSRTRETSYSELAGQFGRGIADVVLEVTDDKALPKAERKQLQVEHAPHLSRAAKLVKLADKIANVRDVADHPPSEWPLERRREYFDWAKAVVDGLRGTHAQLEARSTPRTRAGPGAAGARDSQGAAR